MDQKEEKQIGEGSGQAAKAGPARVKPPGGARGQAPYSPSDSTDEMEWDDEIGINRLFGSEDESDKLPSSRRKVKEVPELKDSSSESESEEEEEEEKEVKASTAGESSSSDDESEEKEDGSPRSPL
jgi:hypothetical protein